MVWFDLPSRYTVSSKQSLSKLAFIMNLWHMNLQHLAIVNEIHSHSDDGQQDSPDGSKKKESFN